MQTFLVLSALIAYALALNCTINDYKGDCIDLTWESCTDGLQADAGSVCPQGSACCVQDFGGCSLNAVPGRCMDFQLCDGDSVNMTATCSTIGQQVGLPNLACCVRPTPPPSAKRALQASINQRGLDLIKEFEGWMACWYKDAAGYPTIGYGHLIKAGEPYKSGSCIDKSKGESILKSDVGSAESCVNGAVKVPLNGNQFSAIVSFTFNLGCGNLKSSTLLQRINSKTFGSVCSELLRWNKAGGKVLAGLTRRRQAECNLFNA